MVTQVSLSQKIANYNFIIYFFNLNFYGYLRHTITRSPIIPTLSHLMVNYKTNPIFFRASNEISNWDLFFYYSIIN
jgi:hypothetical protein